MNVYLVELPVGKYTYGDDYTMVIVAEDDNPELIKVES